MPVWTVLIMEMIKNGNSHYNSNHFKRHRISLGIFGMAKRLQGNRERRLSGVVERTDESDFSLFDTSMYSWIFVQKAVSEDG